MDVIVVRLYRNIGLASLAGLGRAGFSFVMAIIVARALGPEGRGQFAFISNLSGLASLIISAGASAALVAARRQRNWDESLLLRGALVITACSAIPVVFGLAGWTVFSEVTVNELLAGVAVPLLVGTTLVTQAAQIRSKFAGVLLSVALGPGLALIALLAVWSQDDLTVRSALFIWAVTMAIGLFPMAISMKSAVAEKQDHSPVFKDEIKWFLRSSFHANIPTVATLLIWRLDLLMIQWFKGDEAVGQYSIAVGVAETIMVVTVGIRSGLVAHIADVDKGALFAAVGPVFRGASAAMSLTSIAISVFSPLIVVTLFGSDYRPAISSLQLLVLGIPFLVLHYPFVDVLIAIGRTRQLGIAAVSLLAFTCAANSVVLWLGEVWMVAGVATATYFLLFLWVFTIARQEFAISLRMVLWPYGSEWRRAFAASTSRRSRM